MVKVPVNTKIDESLRERAMRLAEERGDTLTGFVEKAIELYLDLDPWFLEKSQALARTLRIPLAFAVQNPAISWNARFQAKTSVWGPIKGPIPEFILTSQGPLTGAPLYGDLFKNFKKDEEEKRREVLSQKAAEAPEKLTEEESAFLNATRQPKSGWVGDENDPRKAILRAKKEHEEQKKNSR